MQDTDDPFPDALATLFLPIAQGMVSRGVTIGQAQTLLKKALVKAALGVEGANATDSRISLLTGLHRKDVRRLRNTDLKETPHKSVNAAARAISFWATTPEFQTADGHPRTLDRVGTSDLPGFNELIARASIDLAPGTILQALLDQNAVQQNADETLQLLTTSFVPRSGSVAQTAAYEATLSAHLTAATHNLTAPDKSPRHFDRIVRYSHLSDASVKTLTHAAATKAQMLLEDINKMAGDLQQEDTTSNYQGRFDFGAYILPTLTKDETSS